MVESLNNQEDTRKKIGNSLQKYLEEVEGLGVVSGVVVGSKDGEKGSYLWNILSEDLQIQQATNPAFYQLSQLAAQFYKDLSDIVPMRISNISPSKLEELKKRCNEQNIDLEIISFDEEKTTIEGAVSKMSS
ncbi:MAG: hypothetical protein Q7R97_03630 [Candidatus Daviesbacteria bacterium]|nr:hypothetical protein [Candidatus Daviesbacteria bacterium]